MKDKDALDSAYRDGKARHLRMEEESKYGGRNKNYNNDEPSAPQMRNQPRQQARRGKAFKGKSLSLKLFGGRGGEEP